MARSSSGKTTKVTAENLVELGAERLAVILVDVADTRADLKRRLRMELAAQQGPGPLTAEIDKRLTALETNRGQITWRARPAFIRDLDALRDLIVVRLAPLDAAAAIDRLWRFMDTAVQSAGRYRERHGELVAVYARAASDLGGMLAEVAPGPAAAALVESLNRNIVGWKAWLPGLLAAASAPLAEDALHFMAERHDVVPGWITLIRQLADAAGDLEAYRATYTAEARKTSSVAVELARRYLAADRVDEAGDALRAAAPVEGPRNKPATPEFDWETLWIDYLDRAGQADDAQAVRWASFERTLSVERVRAFVGRLGDFDDVEAEGRAFQIAAAARDAERGLRFLMEWPALPEAGRMIEQRRDEIQLPADVAELWAAKLRRRFPTAAHALLRGAAAVAFRRRDFTTCDRLTAEAETIDID